MFEELVSLSGARRRETAVWRLPWPPAPPAADAAQGSAPEPKSVRQVSFADQKGKEGERG